MNAKGLTAQLDHRTPYRFADLLEFYRARTLEGIELVDSDSYARTVRIAGPDGKALCGWVRVADDAKEGRLAITMAESLAPCAPQVVERVRRMFDVDRDPHAVEEGLAPLLDIVPAAPVEGTLLPGCFEPFETACRAVLGQQVSVKAANKLAARITDAFGAHVETDIDGLSRAWPTPAEVLALGSVEDAFGELGVIKTRSRTITEIARLIEAGELELNHHADTSEQMKRLLAIKGIGPWTANYIAMRALSHPDAFLEGDVGVAHALPDLTPKERLAMAEAWRPWRSYAVIALWNSLSD